MPKDFEDSLITLETKYENYRNQEQSFLGSINLLQSQIEESKTKLEISSNESLNAEKSIKVLDLAQKSLTERVKINLEETIGYALESILGSGCTFQLEFKKRGNFQEVDFNIVTPELPEFGDPIESEAGGVLDIISLVLRITILELYQPRIDGPIILDESFKQLSRMYLEPAANFLNLISEKTGRQIIMISHKDEFTRTAQNVVEVK